MPMQWPGRGAVAGPRGSARGEMDPFAARAPNDLHVVEPEVVGLAPVDGRGHGGPGTVNPGGDAPPEELLVGRHNYYLSGTQSLHHQ